MRAVVVRITLAMVTLVLVTLAGSLAACSDDPPTPTASSTATAPPSTSATPTASASLPTAPEAKPTPESAEAFVRYFWDVFNYAHLALDPDPLKAISEPQCLFCTSATDVVAGLSRAGKRVEGGLVSVETAAVPPGDVTDNPVITMVISQTPGQTLDSHGVTSKTSGVRNMRSELVLHWTGSSWRVRDVANDEKSGTKW